MELCYFSTHRRALICGVTRNAKEMPLPQDVQRRLERQNTLSLRQIFYIKLFVKFEIFSCLIVSFLPQARHYNLVSLFVLFFRIPAVGHYYLGSFLVLYLAFPPSSLRYYSVSFLLLCLAVSPVLRH